MEIKELYQLYTNSVGVNTDTRTVSKGEIYFALRGDRFDGNAHAFEALDKGASYVVIDNGDYHIDERTLLVDHVLETLQELAHYHAQQYKNPIIGLTGSNGKTTTKELLHLVLSSRYNVNTTAGNYNNHIGMPLSILKGKLDQDFWLIEMGTNAPGEIGFLCDIATPDYGLITNIGAAHLEKLIDLDGVFKEKMSLFRSVIENEGLIFLNESDPYLNKFKPDSNLDVITYNSHQCLYGQLELASQDRLLEFRLTDERDEVYMIRTKLVGSYNQVNVSAALTVGSYFNVDLHKAIEAIASYEPDNMRSQMKRTDNNLLLLDNYNANPSSMKASIQSFIESDHVNPLCIIGDMLELGTLADQYHVEVIDLLIDQDIEFYVVGDCFSKISDSAFPNTEALRNRLIDLGPITGRTILLKGSRGVALEKLIDIL